MRGISTWEAANAYEPSFIADLNQRFGKPPRSDHDAHRPLRAADDLTLLLAYRVWRKVTHALTVQYDRVMYLLEDTPANRLLIHQQMEVVEYPSGCVEVQAGGEVQHYRIVGMVSREMLITNGSCAQYTHPK